VLHTYPALLEDAYAPAHHGRHVGFARRRRRRLRMVSQRLFPGQMETENARPTADPSQGKRAAVGKRREGMFN
jgi:hypothetical protein